MTAPWTSPTIPWEQCTPKRQEALYAAWNAGQLRYKLDPMQKGAVDAIYASHGTVKSSMERLFCLDLARRSGKDFCMATIAIQEGMRNRRSIRIPYAAPTRENVHDLLIPTFRAIFADCPPELLPYEIKKGTFRTNSPELNWDWGAHIVLVGVDLHPEWLRGTDTYCFMFTEPAFCENLQELMQSVLLPQLLTNPDGFGVLGSTPPVTPGHYWSTTVVPQAKQRGMYVKKTIYDNPRIPPEQIAGAIETCGGAHTTQFRREYMCEHIIESTLAVVPEFADAKAVIVDEKAFVDPPAYRDTYTVIDPGFAHATGALFAYTDFRTGLIMVEGDFKTQGLNSAEVARRIKSREWQLWGRVPQKPSKLTEAAWLDELELIRSHFYKDLPPPPSHPVMTWLNGQGYSNTFRRVSDTDSRLIADMQAEHGLFFIATEKDNTEAHNNALRLKIAAQKFRIHPRCVNFITDLEQAVWNRARTKLAEEKSGAHYDTIKAGEYLNRNLVLGRNPFPPTIHDPFTHHLPKSEKTAGAFGEAFKGGAGKGRGRSGLRRGFR